jgi:hypothetical protein
MQGYLLVTSSTAGILTTRRIARQGLVFSESSVTLHHRGPVQNLGRHDVLIISPVRSLDFLFGVSVSVPLGPSRFLWRS